MSEFIGSDNWDISSAGLLQRDSGAGGGGACQWPVGFMRPINKHLHLHWLTVGICCEVDSGSHFGRVQWVK